MDRVKLPSFETVVHILIGEIFVNAAWYGLTRLVEIESPIRDWGFLALSVVVIIIIGWYLRKRIPTASPAKEAATDIQPVVYPDAQTKDKNQQYADWMATNIARDKENFPQCIQITIDGRQIVWQHFLGNRPYLEFPFRIHSSSIYIVAIESIARGYLVIDEDMDREPVITTPIKELNRSHSERLVIRQGFTPKDRDELLEPEGKEVKFNFGKVVVVVKTKRPDGADGPNFEMTLPAVSVKVPTRYIIEK